MNGQGDPRADAEHFRLLADNASDIVYRTNSAGIFEWVSPSIQRRLGWDPRGLIGTRALDLVVPDDEPRAAAVREAVYAGSEIADYECRFRTADGGYRWVSVHAHPVRDAAGAIIGAVVGLIDIDREVRGRRALDASEERYRLLVQHSLDIILLGRLDRPEWISPAITELLGHDAVDLARRSMLPIVHPEDVALLEEARLKSAAGEAFTDRYRLRHRDGGWHWFETRVRPLADDDGRFTGRAVSTWRLIDDQIAATEALARSERHYRLLAENSSDVVALIRDDGNIEWVSESLRTLYGIDPAAIVGSAPWHFVHPDEEAFARERLSAAARTGETMPAIELRLMQGDGTFRWQSATAHRVPSPDQEPGRARMVVAFRDVDAEVRARHELAELAREVQYQMEFERAVAAAQGQYKLLADNASDVVYQASPDGLARWVAPSITRVLGWRPDELVGTSMTALVHPDDLAGAADASRRAYSGQAVEPIEVTLRARHRDGRHRWLSGYVTSLFDEEGAFIGVVVSMRDVDDLVRARETAEDERERARATLDSLLDPHVVVEARTRPADDLVDLVYVDANEAACIELGRTRQELIGTLVSDVVGGVVSERTAEQLARVLDTGETLALDEVALPLPGGDGQRRYDLRAVRRGEVVGITWRDVTERHAAVTQVAESEQRYRLLTEQLEDLLAHGSVLAIRARGDGELVWVSRSVARLLGYDPVTAIGKRVQDWVHPNDVARLGAARASLSADGTPMPLQLRLLTIDGNYRTFDGMAFRADDAGGRRELFQVTMADVTDREQAIRLREQLMAVASHELRSPLAFISGSLRLFDAGVVTPDSDRGKELLRRVTATSERLARIADSLLRLQNLELTDVVMPTDVVELVRVVTEAVSTVPLERGVSIACAAVPDGELWWRADADEVTQAVVNLAVNAVKHSPDGATVDVSVVPTGAAVHITVRDRGAGVAPEHRQAVFEAFHQLERRDRSGGVGLGLAIVAKIAERHAGRVWVEDPPEGTGACFVLELGHVPPPPDS